MKIKITVYYAEDGWRWHMKRSGRIIAESGEAYVDRRGCTRAVTNLVNAIHDGKYQFD